MFEILLAVVMSYYAELSICTSSRAKLLTLGRTNMFLLPSLNRNFLT